MTEAAIESKFLNLHKQAIADHQLGASLSMNRREAVKSAVRILAPRIPRHEFEVVTDHALGSRGLQTASPEAAAWLSLVSYIRHQFTDYDGLLAEGYDQDSARFFVLDDMNRMLEGWGAPRRVEAEEGD